MFSLRQALTCFFALACVSHEAAAFHQEMRIHSPLPNFLIVRQPRQEKFDSGETRRLAYAIPLYLDSSLLDRASDSSDESLSFLKALAYALRDAPRIPLGRKELDRAPVPLRLWKIFQWADSQSDDFMVRRGLEWYFYYPSVTSFASAATNESGDYGLWGYGYSTSYSDEPGYSLSRYGLFASNQALPFEKFPTPARARKRLARFYREEMPHTYETHLFRRPGEG